VKIDHAAPVLVGQSLVDLPVGQDLAAQVAIEVETAEAVAVSGLLAAARTTQAGPETA
jgi:hypothetical protein